MGGDVTRICDFVYLPEASDDAARVAQEVADRLRRVEIDPEAWGYVVRVTVDRVGGPPGAS